ncbi:MAG: dTMP kinase, partial [Myxococcota bacterium]|nr:dTMP kinase [Myxococcota bacterium]
VLSSLAYQGVEVDEAFVRQVNDLATSPDLTLFLRVDPEVAMARIQGSRTEREIFENLPFQRQVAARYEAVVETWMQTGSPTLILDGEAHPDQVTDKLVAALKQALNR